MTLLTYALNLVGKRNRIGARVYFKFGLFFLCCIGLYFILIVYHARFSTPELAGSTDYRIRLWDQYVPVIRMRPWWGWGLSSPIIDHAWSLDNHYLLEALHKGLIRVALFVAVVAWSVIQLLRRSMRMDASVLRDLVVSMAAVFLTLAICLYTVWLDPHTRRILFFMFGWGQAMLDLRQSPVRKVSQEDPKLNSLDTSTGDPVRLL